MKLLKSFSLYSFSSLLDKSIVFLIIPILTNYLNPEAVGKLSIIQTANQLIFPLISLGLWNYISVIYVKINTAELRNTVASVLSIFTINAIALSLLIGVSIFFFDYNTIGLPNYILLIMPIIGAFNATFHVTQSYFEIRQNAAYYFVNNVVKGTSSLAFSVLLIVTIPLGYLGRVVGIYLSEFLSFIFSISFLKRKEVLSGKTQKRIMLKSVAFGLPLVPHLMSQIIISGSDRFFISYMVSFEASGIYDISYRLGMVVSIGALVILNVWRPKLYRYLAAPTIPKTRIVLGTYGFIGLLIFGLILINLISPIIYRYLISTEFHLGLKYIFPISLGGFFYGSYLAVAGMVFFAEKTKYIFTIALISVLLNLILNFVLIKQYGVFGAIYSTVVSYFLTFIFVAFKANKLYSLPWLKINALIAQLRIFNRRN